MSLHDKFAPRYTSYPTAPEWGPLEPQAYINKLRELARTDAPLSLYFHIPFCKSMCLFCGCSVILNRKPENEERYVDYVCKEIDLLTAILGRGRCVTQLHFGGGTPTKLAEPLFVRLFEKIKTAFALDFSKEIAIEIDPRTVMADEGSKLRLLRSLGFNRVSFGVQDTDPKVQKAVRRYQSLEMSQKTYFLARELGFEKINLDLIYGLPLQTRDTFKKTVEDILEMRPDRIALFSYAKVPWLKKHQQSIPEESLPTVDDKFAIYCQARERFIESGYVGIGMDHFALSDDELAECYRTKRLQRNFQGYTAPQADEMLGIGVTAIGFTQGGYFQNIKELPAYYKALDRGELPIYRGRLLSEEDLLRKWVIHTLMCTFELDKEAFRRKWGVVFDDHFSACQRDVHLLEKEGLITVTPEKLLVTKEGELQIRVVAMIFDAYLKYEPVPKFSRTV